MRLVHIISCMFIAILFINCQPLPQQPFIAVNLLGYNANDSKQALLVNTSATGFEIIDPATSELVYEGSIIDTSPPDPSTGDQTSVIDFSDFGSKGYFMIQVKEKPEVKSQQFLVGSNLYKDATLTAIQSYYYARCGTAIDNQTRWKHASCHLNDGIFYDDPTKHKDVTGGWHDAGDYNKFAINTVLSVGLLLNLFEMKSAMFTDGQLNIPESQNGTPDLLDEVRWSLEWLLKMQDERGGIYHKVSQKKWVGEFLPEDDPEQRYIFEVSSNATAGFAAVAALGAELYHSYDYAFAEQLYNASLRAWRYLEEHPEIQPSGGFTNPPDVTGGEYSDSDDTDERLWAAAELYKLTGGQQYLDYFVETYPTIEILELSSLSWRNFHAMALSSFLQSNVDKENQKHQQHILRNLIAHAEGLLHEHKSSNYKTMLNEREYYWGSNSVTLGYAYLLIQLYEQTGIQRYYDAALDQLHYTMGRNPFNKSFITGSGSSSVKNPYHQFSMKLDYQDPVPGMLVGGPNNHVHLRDQEISKYPGKNYVDNENNFFVNEVAINWTAIFAYVSGYFSSPDDVLSTAGN